MNPFDPKTLPQSNPVESEVVTQLKAAKALISDPEHWCQNQATGHDSRCAYVAMAMVSGLTSVDWISYPTLRRASKQMGHKCPIHLNDETDHPTVMKMFDLAIQLAEETP